MMSIKHDNQTNVHQNLKHNKYNISSQKQINNFLNHYSNGGN